MRFPSLPSGTVWDPNTRFAHQELQGIFDHGQALLALDDQDPIRLQLQVERISGQAKQLLKDCEGIAPL